ncbi:hypothetical protein PR048_000728 [Dryococelus australis]|uniref:Uncharacterized protein n=1 Tax=Dryococelus australis TaxID=614101 RepID=A0ABQ9IFK1_9NEOP|nr:hypothetical protein PR048_000728 [Dryococelus australis]
MPNFSGAGEGDYRLRVRQETRISDSEPGMRPGSVEAELITETELIAEAKAELIAVLIIIAVLVAVLIVVLIVIMVLIAVLISVLLAELIVIVVLLRAKAGSNHASALVDAPHGFRTEQCRITTGHHQASQLIVVTENSIAESELAGNLLAMMQIHGSMIVEGMAKAWLDISRPSDGYEMVQRWAITVVGTWAMLGPFVFTTPGPVMGRVGLVSGATSGPAMVPGGQPQGTFIPVARLRRCTLVTAPRSVTRPAYRLPPQRAAPCSLYREQPLIKFAPIGFRRWHLKSRAGWMEGGGDRDTARKENVTAMGKKAKSRVVGRPPRDKGSRLVPRTSCALLRLSKSAALSPRHGAHKALTPVKAREDRMRFQGRRECLPPPPQPGGELLAPGVLLAHFPPPPPFYTPPANIDKAARWAHGPLQRIFVCVIVPDDAAGQRVFSGISRFPHPCIPALLHTHSTSSLFALKALLLRVTKISSLNCTVTYTEHSAECPLPQLLEDTNWQSDELCGTSMARNYLFTVPQLAGIFMISARSGGSVQEELNPGRRGHLVTVL